MTVTKTTLIKQSRLYDYFTAGDFLDCYSVPVGGTTIPISELAQSLFQHMPPWVKGCLAVRDLAVLPFGLKSTARLPTDRRFKKTLEVGDSINFFCVHSLSENEIILGEDDSHLDFRISLCRESAASPQIFMSTWVHPHNLLGRLYLASITPLHILIVTSQLKKLARQYADLSPVGY